MTWRTFQRPQWPAGGRNWITPNDAITTATRFVLRSVQKSGTQIAPRMLIFRGVHGTGKSVLLKMLKPHLTNMFGESRVIGPFDMAWLLEAYDAADYAHGLFRACDPKQIPAQGFIPNVNDPNDPFGLFAHVNNLIKQLKPAFFQDHGIEKKPLVILLDNLHALYKLKIDQRDLWRVMHNLFIDKLILANDIPVTFICATRHAGDNDATLPTYLENPLTKLCIETNDLSAMPFTPEEFSAQFDYSFERVKAVHQEFYGNPLLIEFFVIEGAWEAYNSQNGTLRNDVLDKAISILVEDSLLPDPLYAALPQFVAQNNNLFESNFCPPGVLQNSVQVLVQLGLAYFDKTRNRYRIVTPLARLIARRHNLQEAV